MKRITAIWPARRDGQPGGSWRQVKRWLVLDVSHGLDQAIILERCADRDAACRRSLELRAAK